MRGNLKLCFSVPKMSDTIFEIRLVSFLVACLRTLEALLRLFECERLHMGLFGYFGRASI